MKIQVLHTDVICSCPDSLHNYFAWPSVAVMQDGSLAAVASGFRLGHLCPFGKCVLLRSTDEGRTWSRPTPVIDTPLDDRDGGILPFGESSVMITSFNNTTADQRGWNGGKSAYIDAYLDRVEAMEGVHERYLGSTFVLSHDGGVTFSEVKRIPVTAPHGPCLLNDGQILYVGRTFPRGEGMEEKEDCIRAYLVHPDGSYERRGRIENVAPDLLSCEPHALCLPSGRILVHIRVQGRGVFTTYQSESDDGGFTFTAPHPLLAPTGGAPAHLLRLRSGRLISVYGYRNPPFGIKVMVSDDDGASWDAGHDLYVNHVSPDLGYPATAELKNGDLYTVFYAHPAPTSPAVLMGTTWRLL